MCPTRVHRVDLRPEAVAGIVFWTRNARPLLPHLDALDSAGYAYYFLYTVIGYPRSIDPRCPTTDSAVRTFAALSQRLGPERVIWRYDPVLHAHPHVSAAWHRENFAALLERLCGRTRTVILSAVDPYPQARRRATEGHQTVSYDPETYSGLLAWMAGKAHAAGLRVQTCAEPRLAVHGAEPGRCVDAELLAAISGRPVSQARHKLRSGCLCHRSTDIGVANTCGFGCTYCYANTDHGLAQQRLRDHDPSWTSLVGNLTV